MEDERWTRVPAHGNIPSHLVYSKEIEKPDSDDRSYRLIKLENGLEALLIHDSTTDKAAAAMNVGVGSLSDPDDMQGLAHFCEHLLFMGTKEFPSEAEYSQYITSNGGSTNAYTDSSNTVYYFTVSHKHLSGALDRFSGFFHSSLFDPDCTMREVRAVDAEAKLYAQSDVWRLWQLFRSNAKPGHPAAKYNVGNVETLTEAAKKLATSRTTNGEGDKDGEDDLIAQETRRRVMTWWQEHYCASIMCLVILGRESLDELTQMAVKGLSPVPNRGLTRPVETHPWGPEQQGYLIFAKTVQENDSLSLQFPLGRQDLLYESKPARYLSHFIGHEGPGSLHSYLKCKGWVTELWSGSFSAGRGIEYMEIDMKLTKSGIVNYKEVIEAFYAYLALLRASPPEPWNFDEFRDIRELEFRFQEKWSAESYASYAAGLLSNPWPKERALSGSYRLWKPDFGLVAKILNNDLVPEKSCIRLSGMDFSLLGLDGPWSKEKWYGTEYMVHKTDQELLSKAKSPGVIKELYLPLRNEYIPSKLSVNKIEVEKPAASPRFIRKTKRSSLWYKKDDQFWLPKGIVAVYIRKPFTTTLVKHALMTRYLRRLVDDALTEEVYNASLAGLSYSLNTDSEWNLRLETRGYNDQMVVLLKQVLEKVRSHVVDEDRFAVYKTEILQELNNAKKAEPHVLANRWRYWCLRHNDLIDDEQLDAFPDITVQDVQTHISEFFSQARVKTLAIGNFELDDVLHLQEVVETVIGGEDVADSEISNPWLLLPTGKSFVSNQTVWNPDEKNNAIVYHLQVGDPTSDYNRTRLGLFSHLIRQETFEVLRTQEQLGYVVSSRSILQPTLLGFSVRIQSERSPAYLENRIDAFLESYGDKLADMDQADFETRRAGLIDKWRQKLDNLEAEYERFDDCISEGTYYFTRDVKSAEIAEEITKDEIIEFYNTYIRPSAAERTKLSIFMHSQFKPEPAIKLGKTAFAAFLKELELAQAPTDNLEYTSLPEANLSIEKANEFFSQYISKFEFITEEKKAQLLEKVKELATLHPVTDFNPDSQKSDGEDKEGKLREGTIVIDDLVAFKQSLQTAGLPVPAIPLEPERV